MKNFLEEWDATNQWLAGSDMSDELKEDFKKSWWNDALLKASDEDLTPESLAATYSDMAVRNISKQFEDETANQLLEVDTSPEALDEFWQKRDTAWRSTMSSLEPRVFRAASVDPSPEAPILATDDEGNLKFSREAFTRFPTAKELRPYVASWDAPAETKINALLKFEDAKRQNFSDVFKSLVEPTEVTETVPGAFPSPGQPPPMRNTLWVGGTKFAESDSPSKKFFLTAGLKTAYKNKGASAIPLLAGESDPSYEKTRNEFRQTMVDLLAHMGRATEAQELIDEPDGVFAKDLERQYIDSVKGSLWVDVEDAKDDFEKVRVLSDGSVTANPAWLDATTDKDDELDQVVRNVVPEKDVERELDRLKAIREQGNRNLVDFATTVRNPGSGEAVEGAFLFGGLADFLNRNPELLKKSATEQIAAYRKQQSWFSRQFESAKSGIAQAGMSVSQIGLAAATAAQVEGADDYLLTVNEQLKMANKFDRSGWALSQFTKELPFLLVPGAVSLARQGIMRGATALAETGTQRVAQRAANWLVDRQGKRLASAGMAGPATNSFSASSARAVLNGVTPETAQALMQGTSGGFLAAFSRNAPLAGYMTAQALRSGGAVYGEAFEAWRNEALGKGMSEDDASRVASLKALVPAITSTIVTGALMKLVPGGTEALFEKGAQKATYAAIRKAADKMASLRGKPLGEFLANNRQTIIRGLSDTFYKPMLREGGKEAIEEGLDELFQGAQASLTYDPDRTFGDIMYGIGHAMLLGGVMGSAVSGFQNAYSLRKEYAKQLEAARGKVASTPAGSAAQRIVNNNPGSDVAAAAAELVEAAAQAQAEKATKEAAPDVVALDEQTAQDNQQRIEESKEDDEGIPQELADLRNRLSFLTEEQAMLAADPAAINPITNPEGFTKLQQTTTEIGNLTSQINRIERQLGIRQEGGTEAQRRMRDEARSKSDQTTRNIEEGAKITGEEFGTDDTIENFFYREIVRASRVLESMYRDAELAVKDTGKTVSSQRSNLSMSSTRLKEARDARAANDVDKLKSIYTAVDDSIKRMVKQGRLPATARLEQLRSLNQRYAKEAAPQAPQAPQVSAPEAAPTASLPEGQPTPGGVGTPAPEPTPEPAPEPTPEPAPEPTPEPATEPAPTPTEAEQDAADLEEITGATEEDIAEAEPQDVEDSVEEAKAVKRARKPKAEITEDEQSRIQKAAEGYVEKFNIRAVTQLLGRELRVFTEALFGNRVTSNVTSATKEEVARQLAEKYPAEEVPANDVRIEKDGGPAMQRAYPVRISTGEGVFTNDPIITARQLNDGVTVRFPLNLPRINPRIFIGEDGTVVAVESEYGMVIDRTKPLPRAISELQAQTLDEAYKSRAKQEARVEGQRERGKKARGGEVGVGRLVTRAPARDVAVAIFDALPLQFPTTERASGQAETVALADLWMQVTRLVENVASAFKKANPNASTIAVETVTTDLQDKAVDRLHRDLVLRAILQHEAQVSPTAPRTAEEMVDSMSPELVSLIADYVRRAELKLGTSAQDTTFVSAGMRKAPKSESTDKVLAVKLAEYAKNLPETRTESAIEFVSSVATAVAGMNRFGQDVAAVSRNAPTMTNIEEISDLSETQVAEGANRANDRESFAAWKATLPQDVRAYIERAEAVVKEGRTVPKDLLRAIASQDVAKIRNAMQRNEDARNVLRDTHHMSPGIVAKLDFPQATLNAVQELQRIIRSSSEDLADYVVNYSASNVPALMSLAKTRDSAQKILKRIQDDIAKKAARASKASEAALDNAQAESVNNRLLTEMTEQERAANVAETERVFAELGLVPGDTITEDVLERIVNSPSTPDTVRRTAQFILEAGSLKGANLTIEISTANPLSAGSYASGKITINPEAVKVRGIYDTFVHEIIHGTLDHLAETDLAFREKLIALQRAARQGFRKVGAGLEEWLAYDEEVLIDNISRMTDAEARLYAQAAGIPVTPQDSMRDVRAALLARYRSDLGLVQRLDMIQDLKYALFTDHEGNPIPVEDESADDELSPEFLTHILTDPRMQDFLTRLDGSNFLFGKMTGWRLFLRNAARAITGKAIISNPVERVFDDMLRITKGDARDQGNTLARDFARVFRKFPTLLTREVAVPTHTQQDAGYGEHPIARKFGKEFLSRTSQRVAEALANLSLTVEPSDEELYRAGVLPEAVNPPAENVVNPAAFSGGLAIAERYKHLVPKLMTSFGRVEAAVRNATGYTGGLPPIVLSIRTDNTFKAWTVGSDGTQQVLTTDASSIEALASEQPTEDYRQAVYGAAETLTRVVIDEMEHAAGNYAGTVTDFFHGNVLTGFPTVLVEDFRAEIDTIPLDDKAEVAHASAFRATEEVSQAVKAPRFSRAGTNDAAYMRAVESGDLATAQRLVYSEAKRAGYTEKAARAAFYRNGVPLLPSSSGNLGAAYYAVLGGTKQDVDAYLSTPQWKGLDTQGLTRSADDIVVNLGDKVIRIDHASELPKWIKDNGLLPNWKAWLDYQETVNAAYQRVGGVRPDSLEARRAGVIIRESPESKAAKKASMLAKGWTEDQIGSLGFDEETFAFPESGKMQSFLFDEGHATAIILDWDAATAKGLMVGSDKRSGKEVAVANPSQMKSAEPIVRDSAGNVIPLSQRFDITKPDIRYSRAGAAYAGTGMPTFVDRFVGRYTGTEDATRMADSITKAVLANMDSLDIQELVTYANSTIPQDPASPVTLTLDDVEADLSQSLGIVISEPSIRASEIAAMFRVDANYNAALHRFFTHSRDLLRRAFRNGATPDPLHVRTLTRLEDTIDHINQLVTGIPTTFIDQSYARRTRIDYSDAKPLGALGEIGITRKSRIISDNAPVFTSGRARTDERLSKVRSVVAAIRSFTQGSEPDVLTFLTGILRGSEVEATQIAQALGLDTQDVRAIRNDLPRVSYTNLAKLTQMPSVMGILDATQKSFNVYSLALVRKYEAEALEDAARELLKNPYAAKYAYALDPKQARPTLKNFNRVVSSMLADALNDESISAATKNPRLKFLGQGSESFVFEDTIDDVVYKIGVPELHIEGVDLYGFTLESQVNAFTQQVIVQRAKSLSGTLLDMLDEKHTATPGLVDFELVGITEAGNPITVQKRSRGTAISVSPDDIETQQALDIWATRHNAALLPDDSVASSTFNPEVYQMPVLSRKQDGSYQILMDIRGANARIDDGVLQLFDAIAIPVSEDHFAKSPPLAAAKEVIESRVVRFSRAGASQYDEAYYTALANGDTAGAQAALDAAAELALWSRPFGFIPDSPRVTSRFRHVQSAEEADEIASRYEAFAIRAGIEPADLRYHLLSGNGVVWSPTGSDDAYVGSFIGDAFAVSHFAPVSLRSANESLLDLLHTQTPVVFAVPAKLASQLDRIGFETVATGIPMTFRGQVMEKSVLINRAFQKEDVPPLLAYWMREAVASGQAENDAKTKEFFDRLNAIGTSSPAALIGDATLVVEDEDGNVLSPSERFPQVVRFSRAGNKLVQLLAPETYGMAERRGQTISFKAALEAAFTNQYGVAENKLIRGLTTTGKFGEIFTPQTQQARNRISQTATFFENWTKRYNLEWSLLGFKNTIFGKASLPRDKVDLFNTLLGDVDQAIDERFRQRAFDRYKSEQRAARRNWATLRNGAKPLETSNPVAYQQIINVANAVRTQQFAAAQARYDKALEDAVDRAQVAFRAKQADALVQLTAYSPNLADLAQELRGRIDALSNELLKLGLDDIELKIKISNNGGIYLTRSYEIHDNPDYAEWIRSNDPKARAIWDNARRMFERELIRKELRRGITKFQRQNGTDPTMTELRALATAASNTVKTSNEADEKMHALIMDHSRTIANRGGSMNEIGRSNVGILKERTEIPPALRQLLGQYTDPMFNAFRTLSAITSVVANREMFDSIYDGLMAVQAANAQSGRVFLTDKAAVAEKNNLVPFTRKGDFRSESQNLHKLNGMYGPEILVRAIEDLQAVEFSAWSGAFRKLTTMSMKALTSWSVRTQIRNVISNPLFLIGMGHPVSGVKYLFANRYGSLRAYAGQLSSEDRKREIARISAYIAEEYARLGIEEGNVELESIKEMVNAGMTGSKGTLAKIVDELFAATGEIVAGAVGRDKGLEISKTLTAVPGKIDAFATSVYTFGDVMFKRAAYESELAGYAKAFGLKLDGYDYTENSLTDAQATEILDALAPLNLLPTNDPNLAALNLKQRAIESLKRKAATQVRESMPYYESTLSFLRAFRRTPGVNLAAPFTAFHTELLRIGFSTPLSVYRDAKIPRLRGVAAKRAAGYLTAMFGGGAIVKAEMTVLWYMYLMLRSLLEGKEKDEPITPIVGNPAVTEMYVKSLANSFYKHRNIFVVGQQGDNPIFVDIDWANPFATNQHILASLMHGEFIDAAIRTVGPFASLQVAVSAAKEEYDAWEEKTMSRPEEFRDERAWVDASKRMAKVMGVAVPATFKDTYNLYSVARYGVSRFGGESEFARELISMGFGTKFITVDLIKATRTIMGRAARQISPQGNPELDSLRTRAFNATPVTKDALAELYKKANDTRRDQLQALVTSITALRYFAGDEKARGYVNEYISGVAKRDLDSALNGVYNRIRFSPTDSFIKRMQETGEKARDNRLDKFIDVVQEYPMTQPMTPSQPIENPRNTANE